MVEKGLPRKRRCPKHKTLKCQNCRPLLPYNNRLRGRGRFSDGKLSLSCEVGGDLPALIASKNARANRLYRQNIFGIWRGPKIEGVANTEEIKEMKRAIAAGLKLVDCPIRHWARKGARDLSWARTLFD